MLDTCAHVEIIKRASFMFAYSGVMPVDVYRIAGFVFVNTHRRHLA